MCPVPADNQIMTDVSNRKRQPKGVPTGGEFASNEHDEASQGLSAESGVDYLAKPSAIVGDAKVLFSYGSTDSSDPSWRAHILVDHNKLPFDHPLHNSQDEDGFIEIGSAPTDEDASVSDLGGVALLRATELEKELQDVGSSHADAVASSFLRRMTGSKADESEVIRRAVNPDAVADITLKKLVEDASGHVDEKRARGALREAASLGISQCRKFGIPDVNDISNRVVDEHHGGLSPVGEEDLKYRAAIIAAASEGAKRVERRREDVAEKSASKRLEGTGLEDDPVARSLMLSAARNGYKEGWGFDGGTYSDMARVGMANDSMRSEYLTWTQEKQEIVRASAERAAMDGHSASYAERFDR